MLERTHLSRKIEECKYELNKIADLNPNTKLLFGTFKHLSVTWYDPVSDFEDLPAAFC